MENTPEKKADELVEKYCDIFYENCKVDPFETAVQCAIIAVDEILFTIFTHKNSYDYWQSVKQILQSKIN